jgi:hypothetical protein
LRARCGVRRFAELLGGNGERERERASERASEREREREREEKRIADVE